MTAATAEVAETTTAAPVPMTRAQVLEVVTKARFAGQRANLQCAYLQGAYLQGADLQGANLQGADLQGAAVGGAAADGLILGPAPDPTLPLAVARMVLADPDKALKMESWHTCDTTHCLAGWAIHLSGPAGYFLEAATSPSVAGLLLAPSLAPYFYVGNDEALEVCRGIVAAAEAAEAVPTN